jgi:hypothetical protein
VIVTQTMHEPWPHGVPSGQRPSMWRPMLGVVLLVGVVVGTLGLAFFAVIDGANKRNYQDHLRSCLAQNDGRRQSNTARAAVRRFMLEAATARADTATIERDPKLKAIDTKAAEHYRAYAKAQVALPLFDCKRVVKRP